VILVEAPKYLQRGDMPAGGDGEVGAPPDDDFVPGSKESDLKPLILYEQVHPKGVLQTEKPRVKGDHFPDKDDVPDSIDGIHYPPSVSYD
jgi:hypothetical protein